MDPLSAVVLEGVVKAVNKGDLDYVRQLLEPLVQVRHANVVKIVPIVEVAMAHARANEQIETLAYLTRVYELVLQYDLNHTPATIDRLAFLQRMLEDGITQRELESELVNAVLDHDEQTVQFLVDHGVKSVAAFNLAIERGYLNIAKLIDWRN